MPFLEFNADEVRKAVELLYPDNTLFEVRAIKGKWNASGYFTSADTLIEQMQYARLDGNANVYITLGVINGACYSRSQHDMFVSGASNTSDNDVKAYKWLMIDFDPKRASGVSSSDAELEKAKLKANKVYTFLQNRGWNEPISALSGNGCHLLYRVAIKNDNERKEKIKQCLSVLSMLFSDDEVELDTTTFNPARVCKLYGTKAVKGADTAERPHRMSRIIKAPAEIQVNDISLIDELINLVPQEKETPQKVNNYNPQGFNLENWIAQHGLNVKEKTAYGNGVKYVLEECPFDSSHRGKDAAIFQTQSGAIGFKCLHNSCSDKTWKDVRLKYEPEAYDKSYVDDSIKPNHKRSQIYLEPSKDMPIFLTTEYIRTMKTPSEEFIKTGISKLDKCLRGLKKGFVTCLSGLRACGKSSIISQLALEAHSQNCKTAIFSGELMPKNFYKWLMLQAAGKPFIFETQYEGYYKVMPEVEESVSKQLDDSIFIYNNDYGNNFLEMLNKLGDCVEKNKVDLIILDNLMTIDISTLNRDKYEQQSAFVCELENFAKRTNTHVLFVAHPRKTDGFLRLQDISGSNDIVNRVDNAIIMHRVNTDFKRQTKDMYKWKDDSELYKCTNVIEICKDRDGGTQDTFIPLYFEKESKRLKNTPNETKRYVDAEILNSMPF